MDQYTCDHKGLEFGDTLYIESSDDLGYNFEHIRNIKYCPICGKELPTFESKYKNKNNCEKCIHSQYCVYNYNDRLVCNKYKEDNINEKEIEKTTKTL